MHTLEGDKQASEKVVPFSCMARPLLILVPLPSLQRRPRRLPPHRLP